MQTAVDGSLDLVALLTLDRIERDRFRNRFNRDNAYGHIFGGQIVAQSLAAATATVNDRSVHSLHGYFMRGGSVDESVDFEVDRVRDGNRFSVRRVTAMQGQKKLFAMDCSFKIPLSGFDHQQPPATHFEPAAGIDFTAVTGLVPPDMASLAHQFSLLHPLETRFAMADWLGPGGAPRRSYWVRYLNCSAITDFAVHQQVLAYMSDFMLSGTALLPHTIPLPGPHVFVASLDHAIWFHRPARCDEWLFFDTTSPSARGGVSLTQARIYDSAGDLVASVAQEALQMPRQANDRTPPAQ